MEFIKKSIQYVSDLHIEKGFKRIINATKPILVLAGDIGYPSYSEYKDFLINTSYNFDKVFVLSGNHEYDLSKNIEEVDNYIENICLSRNNLIYLQKKTEKLCDKENIKIAGCTFWSRLPKSKYKYHLEHKKWLEDKILEDQNHNYIIATHHCPLFQCLDRSYHNFVPNYFATDQTNIIKKDNVLAWIHGHSHNNKDFNIYGKWIISNQYGYFQNPMKNYKKF
jgi:Icc-related predicted phosphoesterase